MADQFQVLQSTIQILGSMADPDTLKRAIINLAGQLQTIGNTLATQSQAPSGAAGGDLGGNYPNPTVAKVTGQLSSYNGIALIGNGVATEVAKVDLVNQNANINATTLYAVPAGQGGFYRATCYAEVTTADGASSTLPNIGIGWTANDSGVAVVAGTVTPTNTANATGAFGPGSQPFYAKAGTNITYQTTNYASGTAGAMKYAMHIKLEYLG